MKILNAAAIQQWDQFTIENEPISSGDLMERASVKSVEWLDANGFLPNEFFIFCGKGNNGGDGLAIAGHLFKMHSPVTVFILEFGHLGTTDFQANLQRLHELDVNIVFIQDESHFPILDPKTIIVDCLYGTGLNRPLEGISQRLVQFLNQTGCIIISIDIPSGLYADRSTKDQTAIQAIHTLSFQVPKLACLMPENEKFIGSVHILDIGLHPDFLEKIETDLELTGELLARQIYKPRKKFSHKGNFGHALLVAGSYGKMGAAILSAKACLRSGAGLLTCLIPESGYTIMQTAVAEAMVNTYPESASENMFDTDFQTYNAIGIGPGIGKGGLTKSRLEYILMNFKKPVVLDADALNIIAENKSMFSIIPKNSILTPHPKEFERLFGRSVNDFERINLARIKAKELNVVIILKGHHSFIATPAGKGYFNSTGNAGMATGGTGDILTGMLTSFLAQGYDPVHAAIFGVYLHGLSGDIASRNISEEALIARDIIKYLGKAFASVQQPNSKMASQIIL